MPCLQSKEERWLQLYKERFGYATALAEKAHKKAGSWKALFASKVVTNREAAPWRKPCKFELDAALDSMTQPNGHNVGKELAVIYLVDGSGSVGEGTHMRFDIPTACLPTDYAWSANSMHSVCWITVRLVVV